MAMPNRIDCCYNQTLGYCIATTHFDWMGLTKEIQCGATFGHALARIIPSRMRPPIACAYAIGEFS